MLSPAPIPHTFIASLTAGLSTSAPRSSVSQPIALGPPTSPGRSLSSNKRPVLQLRAVSLGL